MTLSDTCFPLYVLHVQLLSSTSGRDIEYEIKCHQVSLTLGTRSHKIALSRQ